MGEHGPHHRDSKTGVRHSSERLGGKGARASNDFHVPPVESRDTRQQRFRIVLVRTPNQSQELFGWRAPGRSREGSLLRLCLIVSAACAETARFTLIACRQCCALLKKIDSHLQDISTPSSSHPQPNHTETVSPPWAATNAPNPAPDPAHPLHLSYFHRYFVSVQASSASRRIRQSKAPCLPCLERSGVASRCIVLEHRPCR